MPVEQLIPTIWRWKGADGVCRVQKNNFSIMSMSGCYGTQSFGNHMKMNIPEFCQWALRNVDALRQIAKEHKHGTVMQSPLHASFEEMRRQGKIDTYTYKTLMHMTKDCKGCTSNRMYYRLKNFFGVEQESLVDSVVIKEENPIFETSISGFLKFCKELEKQSFQPSHYSPTK